MQTLDARNQDGLDSRSLNERFYELFASDAAQAATLVDDPLSQGTVSFRDDGISSPGETSEPTQSSTWQPYAFAGIGGAAGITAAVWGTKQTNSLREEIEAATTRAQTAEKHLSALQIQLQVGSPSALTKAVSSIQGRLAETSEKLTDTEKKLASWRATAGESAAERDQVQKQCSDLRRALSASEAAAAKLNGELSEQSASRAAAEKDAEGAHAEAAQRQQAEVEVRKQLAEARARGDDLQEEAAQLTTRLQAAVDDGDAAKSLVVAERGNSATLERARSSAVQDVRKLLSEKRQLETTLGGSQAEVEELVADLVAQRKAQMELEMAISALGTNCEELEAQLKDAAARENALLLEVEQEATGHDETLQSLRAVAAENSSRQRKLREAMEACQHLQSEVDSAQAEVAKMKAKMGAKDAEARELEGDITIAVRDVQEALNRETQALSQAEEEREAAEEAIKRMVEAEDSMEFSHAETARLRSRLSAAETELEELNSGLMAELISARKQLAARTAELDTALAKQPQPQQGSAPAAMSPLQQQPPTPEPQPVPHQAPPPRRRPSASKGASEDNGGVHDKQPAAPSSPLMSRGQSAAAGKRAKGKKQ